jgi:hypothetical protein
MGSHRGARCSVTHLARRLSFNASRGHHRLKLTLRGLPRGRYAGTIVAVAPNAKRSRAVTVHFRID